MWFVGYFRFCIALSVITENLLCIALDRECCCRKCNWTRCLNRISILPLLRLSGHHFVVSKVLPDFTISSFFIFLPIDILVDVLVGLMKCSSLSHWCAKWIRERIYVLEELILYKWLSAFWLLAFHCIFRELVPRVTSFKSDAMCLCCELGKLHWKIALELNR